MNWQDPFIAECDAILKDADSVKRDMLKRMAEATLTDYEEVVDFACRYADPAIELAHHARAMKSLLKSDGHYKTKEAFIGAILFEAGQKIGEASQSKFDEYRRKFLGKMIFAYTISR